MRVQCFIVGHAAHSEMWYILFDASVAGVVLSVYAQLTLVWVICPLHLFLFVEHMHAWYHKYVYVYICAIPITYFRERQRYILSFLFTSFIRFYNGIKYIYIYVWYAICIIMDFVCFTYVTKCNIPLLFLVAKNAIRMNAYREWSFCLQLYMQKVIFQANVFEVIFNHKYTTPCSRQHFQFFFSTKWKTENGFYCRREGERESKRKPNS